MTISIDDLRLGIRVSATDRNGNPINGEGQNIGIVTGLRVGGKIEGHLNPPPNDLRADMVSVRFDTQGTIDGTQAATLFLSSVALSS